MKYQFCIRFKNIDTNSAASKAVIDCNEIFSRHGYTDHTLTVGDNSNKVIYYTLLFREILRLFASIEKGSVVGIQYPLLSINKVFKYFIRIAKLKGIKFFCVIHDLESIRNGGADALLVAKEIENLSYYDTVIAHNSQMKDWLIGAGLKTNIITLTLFDYLSTFSNPVTNRHAEGSVVFAGNLAKSTFIYSLGAINGKKFNLYGPGFNAVKGKQDNVNWAGQYSPDEIVNRLDGSFGLIWDGRDIDQCDDVLGEYLKYNNPHKCSLYIAAGLPVIAPSFSAIGKLIKELNIGILVNSLKDLEHIRIDHESYAEMLDNVSILRTKVINGEFFSNAIARIEKDYATERQS